MIKYDIITDINSKDILDQIFSFLPSNVYFKIIKYNKKIQQSLNINIEDSIFNYNYNFSIKTISEIESDIMEMKKKLISIPPKNFVLHYASFSFKFCLKYSYPFEINLNEKIKNLCS